MHAKPEIISLMNVLCLENSTEIFLYAMRATMNLSENLSTVVNDKQHVTEHENKDSTESRRGCRRNEKKYPLRYSIKKPMRVELREL